MTTCKELLGQMLVLNQILNYDYGGALRNVGEYVGRDFAGQMLGHQPTGFVPAKHGYDGLFRADDGKLVVLEVKTSEGEDPLELLADDAPGGKQMEKGWIETCAKRMADPNSSYYADNPDNAELGKEVLQAIKDQGVDGVHRVLVHIDPETHGVDHYEKIDGKWERVMSYTGPEVEERLYSNEREES